MADKRVLITGGTGFVGYWIWKAKSILAWEHGLSEAASLNHTDYMAWNWEAHDWTHIIHLAPIAPTRVLEYARKHNCRILFASSGAVYAGNDQYATNKRAWEKECLDSGADVVIARLYSFIGEKLHRHAIYEFIQQARLGGPIVIKGDGTSIRTYLYGEDLGRWMWNILLNGEGIYNVGGQTRYTMYEMAAKVAHLLPSEIKLEYRKDYPRTNYVPDVRRALALGCEKTVGVVEALKRTITND
jgi:nucleoside-diphosphate-sugar epimerase